LEEQEKDFGKPVRLGETVISQDDAYSRLALRTVLAPVLAMVVLVAVNDTTTGTGIGGAAASITTTFVAVMLPVEFFTVIPKV
jgi:hypothetical protein